MVKASAWLSAKRRWRMAEVIWSVHHMHSALDRAGKATATGFKYITHQQLTAIVGHELSKNNACWAAGTVWVRTNCIPRGGPFSAQGADIHSVWRVYQHKGLFHQLGTLTVSSEGSPLWEGQWGRVAVDHNLSCVHLATSQLGADAFGRLDCEGRTALDVAVDRGHEEAALHLFQRSRAWDQIAPHRLLTLVPWISKHQSHDQLKLVCSLLMEKCGKVVRAPSGNLREMDDGSVRQRAFYAAVLNKRLLEMELLIGLGACVSSPDLENKGYTPLMYAAQLGHVEGVATLLAAEASVDAQAKDGRTALMIASQHGHISAVRALLDAGAAVGITKANGRTAVMMASQNGHVMVIRALLEARALVATQDGGFGRTALMLASKNGHVPAIQELLRAGAAVNTCENDGHTACMFAAENGHVSVQG